MFSEGAGKVRDGGRVKLAAEERLGATCEWFVVALDEDVALQLHSWLHTHRQSLPHTCHRAVTQTHATLSLFYHIAVDVDNKIDYN